GVRPSDQLLALDQFPDAAATFGCHGVPMIRVAGFSGLTWYLSVRSPVSVFASSPAGRTLPTSKPSVKPIPLMAPHPRNVGVTVAPTRVWKAGEVFCVRNAPELD